MGILRKNGNLASDVKLLLNKMNSTAQKVRLGDLLEDQKGCARGEYDFSVSGGAAGAISLLNEDGEAVKLPDNAIITNAFIDVITQPTSSGTPTVSVGAVAADDLLGATALASFTGLIDGVPDNTAANMIKLSAEQTLDMTITGPDLTAGKFFVLVDYVVTE